VSASASGTEIPWYWATSYTITTGSLSSGTLSHTYEKDGVSLVINETTGTPGSVLDFTFGEYNEVPTTNLLVNFQARYDGSTTHNVKLQQWDYTNTSWTNVTGVVRDFATTTALTPFQFTLIDDSDYLSGGQIKLRLNHSSAGNATHDFYIDWMELIARLSSFEGYVNYMTIRDGIVQDAKWIILDENT
jgi:hypothetical protein